MQVSTRFPKSVQSVELHRLPAGTLSRLLPLRRCWVHSRRQALRATPFLPVQLCAPSLPGRPEYG